MMNFKATDEMEMDKYKKELAAWEKEKYRQKYEFCITENDRSSWVTSYRINRDFMETSRKENA